MPSQNKTHILVLISIVTFTYLFSVFILPNIYVREFVDGNPSPFDLTDWRQRYYQFKSDIPSWIRITRSFPFNAETEEGRLRINRPLYLTLSASVPRLIHIINNLTDLKNAFKERLPQDSVMIWMIVLNYIFVVPTVLIFYTWLQKYFDSKVAFNAGILLALSAHILNHSLKPSPEIAATFSSLLIIYIFDTQLMSIEHPSWRRIFVIGLGIGFLFFIKASYHIMFTILLWALYMKRPRIFIGLSIFHIIPLILWILILPLLGAQYYNHEVYYYRQVVWVLDYLSQGDILGIIQTGIKYGSQAFSVVLETFSPFVLILASWAYSSHNGVTTKMKRVMFLGFFSTVFFLMLILRAPNYILFDIYMFLYPLTILALIELSKWLSSEFSILKNLTFLYPGIFIVFVLVNTIFSWIALSPLGVSIQQGLLTS